MSWVSDAMTWTELQDRLQVTLRLLGDRCELIVAAPAEAGGGYVQFLGLGAALEAEASGPKADPTPQVVSLDAFRRKPPPRE